MNGVVEGTTFAGRYQIVRCIASGGMGAVYEVVHLMTFKRRALKVMHPHVLRTSVQRVRFQREAKVDIESEFIVEVFDSGYDEATMMPFLVMELLRGEGLDKRVQRLGRLEPSEVILVLYQTSLALDETHRASIVHRDLKPENLFLTFREDGSQRIKVLDFGIAKILAESTMSDGATQSIGTPLYMAPEQFNPSARLTGAADLYALAMVAFKLLVGVAYWAEEARGGNPFALAAVAMHGPREPATVRARRHGVRLPPSFDAWFARATARDPSTRFAKASEMVCALADALGEFMPGQSLPGRAASVRARVTDDEGTDATLQAAKRQDANAWRLIIRMVYRRSAFMLGRDDPAVEDVTQEAVTSIHNALKSGQFVSKHPGAASAWIRKIATNAVLGHVRKRAARGYGFTDSLEQDPELAAPLDAPINDLADALSSLRERDRIALILHFVDGLTFEEMAQTLGLGSVNTAKSRVQHAKDRLRSIMRLQEDELFPEIDS